MEEEKKRVKNQDKLKEINHLLEKEGVDITKHRPKPRYLKDESYEITDETLCILSSAYNILIIHNGKVEKVNDLSPEEIVGKIKEYARKEREEKAK